uniref:Uncharacterized protein n=1 Tax=Geospiza parvula TaxID=87175 RepID=A0A8C3MEF0_GEOPR
ISAFVMQKLMDRPCPEQFSDQYKPEWPKMKELLAKAAEPKSCLQKISECVRAAVSFRSFYGPEEDGVLDHMVKVTTSLGSPFIALGCRTVCPGSPPCVGKRRLAVQEILRKIEQQRLKSPGRCLLPRAGPDLEVAAEKVLELLVLLSQQGNRLNAFVHAHCSWSWNTESWQEHEGSRNTARAMPQQV